MMSRAIGKLFHFLECKKEKNSQKGDEKKKIMLK